MAFASQRRVLWIPDERSLPPGDRFLVREHEDLIEIFPISKNRIDHHRLMDSMSASPGRYAQAALLRAFQSRTSGQWVVINPLVHEPDAFKVILEKLGRIRFGTCAVLRSNSTKLPLAYAFDSAVIERSKSSLRALNFLSCFDADIDTGFLSKALGIPVPVVTLPCEIHPDRWAAGFNAENCDKLLVAQTRRALDAWGSAKLPLAILPYEAGDVLFASLAMQSVAKAPKQLAVLEKFAPIVRRVAPDVTIFELKTDLPDSVRKALSDVTFFMDHIVRQLPPKQPYSFFRPLRRYDQNPFHIIDQVRFALGEDPQSEGELYESRFLDRKQSSRKAPHHGKMQIFMHFDGGWKLKQYPQKWRNQLLEALLTAGHEVTVLGSEAYGNCRVVPFSTIHNLEEELDKHDVMIGVDSFPAHFASLVTQIPVFQLFGPTQKANSAVLAISRHVNLTHGIGCSPCGKTERCERFLADICLNYSRPEEIMAAFEKWLRNKRAGRACELR